MPKAVNALQLLSKPGGLPEAPAYAVFGPEAWLRRRALKALLQVLEERGFETRRLDEPESAAFLLDELRSPGLFSGATAFVLRNERRGNRNEITSRFKDELAGYLDNPSKRNILVFEGVTWQRNLLVPKRFGEKFPTFAAEEIKPWDQRGWVEIAQLQARDAGVLLDAGGFAALRDAVGGDLARAGTEMEKLALIAEGRKIGAREVNECCGYEGIDVTFPLCDAVLTADRKTGLSCAAKIAARAEIGSVLSLLALLRNQVVSLGRVSLAIAAGKPSAQAIADSKVRLRGNMTVAFTRAARRITRRGLEQAIDVLLNADASMKSTAPDPSALVISVVSRLFDALYPAEMAVTTT